MHIGFFPILSGVDGGIYQYSLTMLSALQEGIGDSSGDEYVVFADELRQPLSPLLKLRNWKIMPTRPPSPIRDVMRRVVGDGLFREGIRWCRRELQGGRKPPDPDTVAIRPLMTQWLRHCGVELALYPTPNNLSFETEIPYVMAIPDLQHRLQPHFPEVSANGVWQWREYSFRNASRYATLLLADSEVGKEDILNFYGPYGVTPDRVKVLPLLPSSYLADEVLEDERQRVRADYDLPDRYLFYPAQFWPHKNHAGIVKALGVLRHQHAISPSIVFCGSFSGRIRKRTFREVMSLAHQLGVERQISYLGYVRDADMSGLYAEAAGLVMPTFFGPTNIPVLEAWAFGCPVVTSDIRGIREQVGMAGILVDPGSAEDLAEGIYKIWSDQTLRRRLAEEGRQRLASYTAIDYRRRLFEILEEAKTRVRSEGLRDWTCRRSGGSVGGSRGCGRDGPGARVATD
jgi:glycosyltransferase involved in cell wall biosynthesis